MNPICRTGRNRDVSYFTHQKFSEKIIVCEGSWPSTHAAVRNGTISIVGCKSVVLHPVDGSDPDIEMAGDLAVANTFIKHARHVLPLMRRDCGLVLDDVRRRGQYPRGVPKSAFFWGGGAHLADQAMLLGFFIISTGPASYG